MSVGEPTGPEPVESPAATNLGRRFFNLRTLASFVVAFALLAFLFSRVQLDVGSTLATMARADPMLMILAMLVYYTTFIARGLRWRYMLHNAGVARPPSTFALGLILLLPWF